MIDRNHVIHIAKLARLAVSEQEMEKFTGQLDAILAYSEQLNSADTTGVEPTSYVVPLHDPMRDDVEIPSLSSDELLQNGPSVKKGHFAVPKIIG
jgi:aspartyl-tRNA(Asn)/glutamyl-tRNA(Gln) amidotransferase subunit C